LKPPSSLGVSGRPARRPAGCELLAFEGEVALVIGKQARKVSPADGWAHVGWVTAANDLGVYDLRYADRGSNLRSKGADGFTPIGPEYLNADDLDPGSLELTTWVNGEVVQHAVLAEELLFDFGYLVADLSRLVTLEPGDVVLTGTPTGSTVVQPGDVVEVEVRAGDLTTGRLRTPIEQDDEALAAWGAMPAPSDQDRLDAFGARADASTAAPPASTVDELLAARYGPNVAAALQSVSTATLTSQLVKRGLNGCMLGELRAMHPSRRLVGFARTLRYLPHREDLFQSRGGGFNAQKRAVEAIRPGDVLVISARGEHNAGTIGDILVQRAVGRGAAGIVTDGAVRDAANVAGLDLPVYFAASHPAPLGRHHVAWEFDVAVVCAGSLVEPGDLLVGDSDGVVVLPEAVVVEVVEASVAQEREERFILDQVRAGASVDGLYPMNAEWRARYEAAGDTTKQAEPT
jgi:regulator of RNase E activity RraA